MSDFGREIQIPVKPGPFEFEPVFDVEQVTEREFFEWIRGGMRYATCWQCGHGLDAHTVEDRGCTDPDCSCAQVPEQ